MVHFDKCFVNGEVAIFKELPQRYRFGDDRISFTDMMTIKQCPYKYAHETWEDIGLSNNDTSAHGIVGHFIMGNFLNYCYDNELNINEFKKNAKELAKKVLTYRKTEARAHLDFQIPFMDKGFLSRLYVTRMFDLDKYFKKIDNFLKSMENIYWLVRPGTFKNLYVESGVYRDIKTPNGNKIIFGKADLIIEHFDDTMTIIDHKSSFNMMFFQPLQLPTYGWVLGHRLRSLVVYDMSDGSDYHYPNFHETIAIDVRNLVDNAVYQLSREKPEIIVGEACKDCTVNCLKDQTDKDGYVTL